MKKYALLALCLAAVGAPAWAADPPLVELSAQALHATPNDMVRATLYAEAQDAAPGPLAQRINKRIAAALETARDYPAVKAQSGATSTYPVYGKSGTTLEGWRTRSELRLESRDTVALSALLGKLQATLAIAGVDTLPAPETRKKGEDAAMVDAIHAFQERARLIGQTLGRKYRIHQMNIQTSGMPPPMPVLRAKAMSMSEAAPMPLEAGETQVSVSVSGQIELLDE